MVQVTLLPCQLSSIPDNDICLTVASEGGLCGSPCNELALVILLKALSKPLYVEWHSQSHKEKPDIDESCKQPKTTCEFGGRQPAVFTRCR